VLVDFVLLSLVSFHFVDFVSFRFVFVDFVSFLFRFALYRYPLFVGFRFLTLQISLDFVFVSFRFVSHFTRK
jgi:hypothetical protein